MRRWKLVLVLLMAALAISSAIFGLRPLLFRAKKSHEIKETNKEFFHTVQQAREETQNETKIPYANLRSVMEQHNKWLYQLRQSALTNREAYEKSPLSLVSFGLPDEIFGVIKIPKMDLEMPLYLGAGEENLANGAAVLSQTSIPVGGTNTNAVIAGHRGWQGYKYFQDIELLEAGDEVQITNLWETLTYTVTEINIVTPDDVDAILIQPGRDMVTLLTCHPYASGGKYRYLVYCDRSETNSGGDENVLLP